MEDHPTRCRDVRRVRRSSIAFYLYFTLSSTVVAAFDPRISGTSFCLSFPFLPILMTVITDKPGSYLDDSQVANEAVAPHSSDPVWPSLHFAL
jgi:hypothetical protein